jgi:hypothetical protein
MSNDYTILVEKLMEMRYARDAGIEEMKTINVDY